MNEVLLKTNKVFSYINNLHSETLGFYFSFIFHFIILLFAIGIANFFEKTPITIPDIIPIEIINVSENTSIPKNYEEKKVEQKEKVKSNISQQSKVFNNSNNQEIVKLKQKDKEKAEIKKVENIKTITKEDIFIKEKIKTPIELEKEKKILIEEKVESLPTKKIKPKIKPQYQKEKISDNFKSDVVVKAKPKTKPEQEYSIASMLKDLRNEQSILSEEKKDEEKKTENNTISENKEDTENLQLTISDIDLLRQQLSSCWIAPAGAVMEKGMIVKIYAKIKPNRRVYSESVRIVDTNISKTNPFYGPITESAMRTLLNPDCIPLKLPKDKHSLWKNLTITFDYSIMKGYE